jgi:Putative zinc-finger
MMKGLMGLGQTEHERVATLLSAYMDERVNARERAQVERHLQTCAACQADLASLRATVQAVRAMPAARLPHSFMLPHSMARQPRPSWTFPILRTATAVVVALFVLVTVGDVLGLNTLRQNNVATREAQPLSAAMQPAQPSAEALPAESTAAPAAKAADETLLQTEPPPAVAPAPATESPMGGGGMGGGGVAPGQAVTPALGVMSASPLTDSNAQPTQAAEAEPTANVGATPTSIPPAVAEQPASTPVIGATSRGAAGPYEGETKTISTVLLRAMEIGLAGLALLLGALALAASGRVR